ncbi:ABC transporter permease [Kutzneria sp. CA-103260]|uniref:ABC transporter permease n=1 Tax=Kutzneria sp. CA-103260 TaxID=2802641 RepID=UPI001BA69E5B|nr:ABC transporter permease [Kutzneria sp. CA-103260]QUQ72183.1 ABC transporter [Kutzneria sp. CA-103260]
MSAQLRIATTELRLYLREPFAVVTTLIVPLMIIVAFGSIITPGDSDPILTYFPALAISFSLAILSMNLMPSILAGYREKGILRRLYTTPVHPSKVLIGQLLVGGAVAVTLAAIVIGAAAVIGFPMPGQPLGFALAFVLGCLSLFSLGLLVAAIAPTGRVASGVGSFLFFVSMFLGGVFTPREVLPGFLGQLGDYTPLGASMAAMRDAWGGHFPQPLHLVVMATITVVFGLASARLFRWE